LTDNKSTDALALLDVSTHPDHIVLAAKIYSGQKRWDIAADKLLSLLYTLDHKVEKDRIIRVLNDLAIVYYMNSQTNKLEELRRKHADIMKGQLNFEFLTRPQGKQAANREEAEQVLKDTIDVTDFISRTVG
jgi:hypothetical protein